MEINFSKYTDKELMESWLSINDIKFPDRAVRIYKTLKERGLSAQVKEGSDNTVFACVEFVAKILLAPFGGDKSSDYSCLEKEQRVLKRIQFLKSSEQ